MNELRIYYCLPDLLDKLPSLLRRSGYLVTVDGEKVTVAKGSATVFMLVGSNSVLFVPKRRFLSIKRSKVLAAEVVEVLTSGDTCLWSEPKTK